MRKYALVVVILAALPCAEAKADVSTGVTISGITVRQNGNQQQWTITMTGTTTLGTDCMLGSYQFYLTDPNGNKLAALVSWTQPAAGQTTNFTATLATGNKGNNWEGGVILGYTDASGNKKDSRATKAFTVP
jgi:hypothetical protein